MKTTITEDDITRILNEGKSTIQKVGEKTTLMVFTTKEGFEIVASSSCVDKENYDEDIGMRICSQKIVDKLYELEGYLLQKQTYNNGGADERFKDKPRT